MAELRSRKKTGDIPAEVIVVHSGSVDSGRSFFAKSWPEARVIADDDGGLYRAFGLERGSAGQLFGPSVWKRALGAFLRGNFIGRPVGDPLLMPGMYLIENGAVQWQHRARHAGEQPDFSRIPFKG